MRRATRSTQRERRDGSLSVSEVAAPKLRSDVGLVPYTDQDPAPLGAAAHRPDLLLGARQALREPQAPPCERILEARTFGRKRRIGAQVVQFLRIGQEVEQ